MPVGTTAVRWAALFSSPFFHPTVLVERDVLERHDAPLRHELRGERGLRAVVAPARRRGRRQPAGAARPLPRPSRAGVAAAPGAPARVSAARRATAIAAAAPELSPEEVELAWRIGAPSPSARRTSTSRSTRSLRCSTAFERRVGGGVRGSGCARRSCDSPSGSALAPTRSGSTGGGASARSRACPLTFSAGGASAASRSSYAARPRAGCADSPVTTSAPARVAAVFPEPTPYRAPLLDRVAAQPGDRPHGDLRSRHRRGADVARRAEAPTPSSCADSASRARSASSTTTTR